MYGLVFYWYFYLNFRVFYFYCNLYYCGIWLFLLPLLTWYFGITVTLVSGYFTVFLTFIAMVLYCHCYLYYCGISMYLLPLLSWYFTVSVIYITVIFYCYCWYHYYRGILLQLLPFLWWYFTVSVTFIVMVFYCYCNLYYCGMFIGIVQDVATITIIFALITWSWLLPIHMHPPEPNPHRVDVISGWSLMLHNLSHLKLHRLAYLTMTYVWLFLP